MSSCHISWALGWEITNTRRARFNGLDKKIGFSEIIKSHLLNSWVAKSPAPIWSITESWTVNKPVPSSTWRFSNALLRFLKLEDGTSADELSASSIAFNSWVAYVKSPPWSTNIWLSGWLVSYLTEINWGSFQVLTITRWTPVTWFPMCYGSSDQGFQVKGR